MSPERFMAGSVLIGLAAVPLLLGARRARAVLMPEADGSLAGVVDGVLALAAFLAAAHLLGALGLLYAGPLAALCAAAGLAAWLALPQPPERRAARRDLRAEARRMTPASALAALPIALVGVAWAARSITTLERGTAGNVDTFWYHMPMAARFAGEHGIGGLYRTLDPLTAFYASDASLLHGSGILLLGGDSLSPLINLGFLALALLAAAAIGRLSGAGLLAPAAVAVVMLTPVMRGTQPGEAKEDLTMLAPLLAAAAIIAAGRGRPAAMAVAGAAIGLVAGAKVTGLAAAAGLAVGAVLLAPPATRVRGAAALAGGAVLTGSTWYLRNLVETGSPVPFVRLPGWDPPSSPFLDGQLGTSLSHYATDFGVWADHFGPSLEDLFGPLWWVVLGAVAAGVVAGAVRGGPARALAASAVVAFLAYTVTPTTAGGPEGEPGLFPFQVRHAMPALLLGLLAGSWTVGGASPRTRTATALAMAVLGVVALAADDHLPRIPPGVVAVAVATVAISGAIALLPAGRRLALGAAVAIALALVGARYREGAYLRGDLAEAPVLRLGPHSGQLATLFEWVGDLRERRVGVVGSLYLYPFYGRSLTNDVELVGRPLPRGGFDESTGSCRTLFELVNAGAYDFLVTVPRGIEFRETTPPREQRCVEAAAGARRVFDTGPGGSVVFAIEGRLR